MRRIGDFKTKRSLSPKGIMSDFPRDLGVRKFLIGYNPDGKCYIIGQRVQKKLISSLKKVDKTEKPYLLWKKIKNLISELH